MIFNKNYNFCVFISIITILIEGQLASPNWINPFVDSVEAGIGSLGYPAIVCRGKLPDQTAVKTGMLTDPRKRSVHCLLPFEGRTIPVTEYDILRTGGAKMSWVLSENGSLPEHAVSGGWLGTEEIFYVGRVYYGSGYAVGTFSDKTSRLSVPLREAEYLFHTFEVLVSSEYDVKSLDFQLCERFPLHGNDFRSGYDKDSEDNVDDKKKYNDRADTEYHDKWDNSYNVDKPWDGGIEESKPNNNEEGNNHNKQATESEESKYAEIIEIERQFEIENENLFDYKERLSTSVGSKGKLRWESPFCGTTHSGYGGTGWWLYVCRAETTDGEPIPGYLTPPSFNHRACIIGFNGKGERRTSFQVLPETGSFTWIPGSRENIPLCAVPSGFYRGNVVYMGRALFSDEKGDVWHYSGMVHPEDGLLHVGRGNKEVTKNIYEVLCYKDPPNWDEPELNPTKKPVRAEHHISNGNSMIKSTHFKSISNEKGDRDDTNDKYKSTFNNLKRNEKSIELTESSSTLNNLMASTMIPAKKTSNNTQDARSGLGSWRSEQSGTRLPLLRRLISALSVLGNRKKNN